MNLILCGLPKSGKTTLGKRLAKTLNRPFIDTDRLIEALPEVHGRTCRSFYRKEGEERFRQVEGKAIRQLKEKKGCIISLGGGTLSRQGVAEWFKSIGTIVYITSPIDTLIERIKRDPPAFLDPENLEGSYRRLAAERVPVYLEAADHVIDSGDWKRLLEVAEKIFI